MGILGSNANGGGSSRDSVGGGYTCLAYQHKALLKAVLLF